MTKLTRSGLWLPTRLRELLLTRERPSKWDDMRELMALDMMARGPWKRQMHELWIDGIPVGVAGGLAGLEAGPPGASITSTLTATEQNVFTAGASSVANTPVNPYAVTPKAYIVEAWGTRTSAGTPGTETYNPRIGTSASGISMGISSSLTPTASETVVPYHLSGVWILRNGGTTAAVATGIFRYVQGPSTTGTGAETTPLIFGTGVSASIDNTVAQGLYMGGVAATSTTNTMVQQGLIHGSWN